MELMKGSLNTFLNAFTYPDRTCYPVASTNLQARGGSRGGLTVLTVVASRSPPPPLRAAPWTYQIRLPPLHS